MQIKIKKLYKDAKLPTHGHPGDAGMDFYAREDVFFKAGGQAQVPTGVGESWRSTQLSSLNTPPLPSYLLSTSASASGEAWRLPHSSLAPALPHPAPL